MDKKGFLQMSFQWIFAIIVGAVIIVLTIYGVTKFINLEQGKQDVQKAQQIETLLNPLESSFETGKSIVISTNIRTKIYTECDGFQEFGEQKISVQQENLEKESHVKNSIKSKNRYIFSNSPVEGKRFFLFSKPFNFPFKVGDLIYLSSENEFFCFQDPPNKTKNELKNLNQENIIVDNCSDETLENNKTTEICFGFSSDCDVNVDYKNRKIEKKGKEIWFLNDSLMYAGIFSNVSDYKCQVKRLMERAEKLSSLYIDKSTTTSSVCSSNELKPLLIMLKERTRNYNETGDLRGMSGMVSNLKERNQVSWGCRLW